MFTTLSLSAKEDIIRIFNNFFMANKGHNRNMQQIINLAYMDSVEYTMKFNSLDYPITSVLDYLDYLLSHPSLVTDKRHIATYPPYSEEEDLIILKALSNSKDTVRNTLIKSSQKLGRETLAHLQHYYKHLHNNSKAPILYF